MTSTNGHSGNGHSSNGHTNGHSNGHTPEGSVIGGQRPEGIDNGEYGWSRIGVHDLVPKTGYREYWYPAIEANKVGRKKYGLFGARGGKRIKLLGEDVVIFKGKDGKFGAVWNRCPHRGALLSFGRCEFEGTISCPYHGYTFDETGLCVGALTEGPESGLNGKLRVKSYPTKVVNGIVFVWMGQTQPVPIEEDMPKEFFDKNFIVHTYSKVWPINWSITIENSGDSHNSYIHRFRMRRLLNMEAFRQLPAYWSGTRVVGETENSMGIAPTVHAPQQAYFPLMDATWPKHVWFRPLKAWRRGVKTFTGKPYTNEYRLPSLTLVDTRNRVHCRWAVPMDENYSMMFTFGIMNGRTWWDRFFSRIYFQTMWRYFQIKGINELEDLPVQRFDRLDPSAPQKLGTNDRAIIHWRRKMPLKSRDALRLWSADKGQQDAIAADAMLEATENFQPQAEETKVVGAAR